MVGSRSMLHHFYFIILIAYFSDPCRMYNILLTRGIQLPMFVVKKSFCILGEEYDLFFVEKLMHVGKFKKFTAYNQHTNTSAYMRIIESETITKRTQVYPGKPSWGRKPAKTSL